MSESQQAGKPLSERLEQLDLRITSAFDEVFQSLHDEIGERLRSASEDVVRWVDERKVSLPEAARSKLSLSGLADELGSLFQSSSAEPGARSAELLLEAISQIDAQTGQAALLSTLVEQSASFADRSAFFLVRQNEVRGWTGRGFGDEDPVAGYTSPTTAIPWREIANADASKVLDSDALAVLADALGFEAGEAGLVIPFVIRGQVAGALYADRIASGRLDATNLRLLVHSAAQSLETSAVSPSASPALRLLGELPPPVTAVDESEQEAEAVSAEVATEEEAAREEAAAEDDSPPQDAESEAVDLMASAGLLEDVSVDALVDDTPAEEAVADPSASEAPAVEPLPEPVVVPDEDLVSVDAPLGDAAAEASAEEDALAEEVAAEDAVAEDAVAEEVAAEDIATEDAVGGTSAEEATADEEAAEPVLAEPVLAEAEAVEAAVVEIEAVEAEPVEVEVVEAQVVEVEEAPEASPVSAEEDTLSAEEGAAWPTPEEIARESEPEPEIEDTNIWELEEDEDDRSARAETTEPNLDAPGIATVDPEPESLEVPSEEAAAPEMADLSPPVPEPPDFSSGPEITISDGAEAPPSPVLPVGGIELSPPPAPPPPSFDAAAIAPPPAFDSGSVPPAPAPPTFEAPTSFEAPPAFEPATPVGAPTVEPTVPAPAGQATVRLDISALQSQAAATAPMGAGPVGGFEPPTAPGIPSVPEAPTAPVAPASGDSPAFDGDATSPALGLSEAASAHSAPPVEPPAPTFEQPAATFEQPAAIQPPVAPAPGSPSAIPSEAATTLIPTRGPAGFASPPPSAPATPAPPSSFVPPAEPVPAPEPVSAPEPEASPEPASTPEVAAGSTQVVPPSDLQGPGLAFANPGAVVGNSGESDASEALHDEARRLARLLVSEIKLYNEEIIDEGRRNGSIYDRLKDDIDRSRQMYEERIDPRLADQEDYFYQELVQRLAGGDEALLGM